MPVRIEVKFHNPDAKLPLRKRTTDAGYDLHSLENATINPGDVVDFDTGMSIVAPPGYYFTVEGRSSLFRAGIAPLRGIIDSTYTGSFIVSLMNVGHQPYQVLKGDRIAQLLPHAMVPIVFDIVEDISPSYNVRGTSGFGSSGR